MINITAIIKTVPFGLLALTSLLFSELTIDTMLSTNLYNVSYALFLVGMLFSWWFNRSRVFFLLVTFALSDWALSNTAAEIVGLPFYKASIFSIVCMVIPVNILIFSSIKERGIFNTWGLLRFGLIFLELFFIAAAVITKDSDLLKLFTQRLVSLDLARVTIPQPALLAAGITLLWLVKKQLTQPSNLNNAFIAVLFAALIGLQLKTNVMAVPIFFCAAGLMLLTAVIQDSYSMAYLDELTGLPARRALKEELMKLHGDYTVAMLDIDFFKKFNDTYGHDTGDEVLRLVASVLKGVTGGGKAFRYGGEEFTIIFPRTKIADALPHLEELRAAVEKTPFTYQKEKKGKKSSAKKLFVTISIGAAERSEKNKITENVMKAADTALYRAKKKGRNCVSK
ncbi:GGDEF domain-containing protein [Pelosinus sp. UFO1]|uniref:GGDEF domain-containing protein n=1 Tax=Pelosinus sp. UFO1 TaxID=484770 RepID=UPI0004D1D9F1|nr:GGDEF domain-containing protein [Pelosinus sp. UFO1]AIF53063.1 diguanylate cyclase [Pelosinus sp. UFO1]